MSLKLWLSGLRPKTLVASLSPVLVATAWAFANGYIIWWWIVGCALAAVLCIQIATNFINDAIDFKKGADTLERQGPTRLVASGVASYRAVMGVGLGFLLAALLLGVPLVWYGGWPILVIGLVSVLMAYAYTGGPYPLAYLGLGEVFVILFFGVVAVNGMVFLLVQDWFFEVLWLSVLVGSLAASLILINNIRDTASDQKAGRRTLPVRFGLPVSRYLLAIFLLLPVFGFALPMFLSGCWAGAVLPLFVLPAMWRLLRQVWLAPIDGGYNLLLAQAGQIQLRWSVFVVASLLICSKYGVFITN